MEADPLGSGPGPVAIQQRLVYFDMTDWRRFERGREPDFFERNIKDVITQQRDRRGCVKGSCMGLLSFGYEYWIIPLHWASAA